MIDLYSTPQIHLYQMPSLLKNPPKARAIIEGSPDYPKIGGTVSFYQTAGGVLLAAEIHGLPDDTENCPSAVFGFHIHEGTSCTGDDKDPFSNAGGHYNPRHCPHPAHAGDLPPLFGNHGYAFLMFLTDRFTVDSILGRTVVIHASPDDFTTQPSGNSGAKIACGRILPTGRRRPRES